MPLLEYGSRHAVAVIECALNKSLENDVPKIEGSGSDACSFEVIKRLKDDSLATYFHTN